MNNAKKFWREKPINKNYILDYIKKLEERKKSKEKDSSEEETKAN